MGVANVKKIQDENDELREQIKESEASRVELLGVLKEMESNLYSYYRKDIADRAKAVIAKAEDNWKSTKEKPAVGDWIVVYAEEEGCHPNKLPPLITTIRYHKDAGFCCCDIRKVKRWKPAFPKEGNDETN